MKTLLILALLGVGSGEGGPCKSDSDCRPGRPHLICYDSRCRIGCRLDSDCINGGWCRAVPFEDLKQCVQVDPKAGQP